jgi:membrane protein YqaA with SNARE-associated domain
VFPSRLNLPSPQLVQLAGAVADSLKFALQAVHLPAPASEQVLHSELQSWQVVAALASGLNLPGSQGTQLAGAVALSFWFALQAVHLPAPAS